MTDTTASAVPLDAAVGSHAPAMRFSEVSVRRGGQTVWSEGTFEIPSGSVVAVIGPNGSGKTTLLQLALGLLTPATGEVTVLGDTPRRGNPRIGYVPQNYSAALGDVVRCRDLVSLGLSGARWGFGRQREQDSRDIDAALDAVGASEYAARRMSHLSGGQQQRVAIAQALAGQPDLLLLDEPLANLDLRNQHAIVHLLGEIRRSRDLTVVVVTHDLNALLPIATAAVYLLDGHAHYGTIDDVVDSDLLTHLYGTFVRVVRTAQGDLFTRAG